MQIKENIKDNRTFGKNNISNWVCQHMPVIKTTIYTEKNVGQEFGLLVIVRTISEKYFETVTLF